MGTVAPNDTDARQHGIPDAPPEVPLTGMLAEFREALNAEIEAARKASRSSALGLVHGELIGRAVNGYQYLFRLENAQLTIPDDLPGDLYVAGRRYDATVISLAGTALTLSVPDDLGAYVGKASLSSNLTNLLRALIARIEEIATGGIPNHAGARLLGETPPSGEPVDLPRLTC